MDFKELVAKARSYRRFKQEPRVGREVLVELVNIARLVPSGANRQPLRYAVVHSVEACAEMYKSLSWAGALKGWSPAEGERPTGYVVILSDTRISKAPDCDAGIAAQTMQLAATEMGFGACMVGSIKRPDVVASFGIPEQYALVLVIALGVSSETVVLEDAAIGGDVTYYRDGQSVHHVPKRQMGEVIVKLNRE